MNFDVPAQPEDYIHRVGRTGRAEATGDAFTFVSPEEEADIRAIEKAVGRRLPRVTLPDFDYSAKTAQVFFPDGCTRNCLGKNAGVVVFDAHSGQRLTEGPIDVGFSPTRVLIARD